MFLLINYPFVIPITIIWLDQTLQVQTPPEWVKLPGPTKGIEKEKVEFACEASGIPHPRYTWVDQYGIDAREKEG